MAQLKVVFVPDTLQQKQLDDIPQNTINPLIRLGRIYGQRANLMGLYLAGKEGLYTGSGVRGFVFERKNTSNCNLLNILLFFLISSFCNNQQP